MKEVDQTLAYYRHHADLIFGQTWGNREPEAVELFRSELRTGARVLDAGSGSGWALRELRRAGLQPVGIEGADALAEKAREATREEVRSQNLLFFSPSAGEWDGIWAHRLIHHLPPAGAQRLLGSFFQGLRPGGVLFLSSDFSTSHREANTPPPPVPDFLDSAPELIQYFFHYGEDELGSLLRQSGFQALKFGKKPTNSGFCGAWLARRLGG
jgi:SAM-dependent methyltransferase